MYLVTKAKEFLQEIRPDIFRLNAINSSINKRMKRWETDSAFNDIHKLDKEQLEKYLETEWIRAKELDEKLNKLTASLSVAVTIGTVATKNIFDGMAYSPVKIIVGILLLLSVSLLLIGALIGFSGLRPKPRYAYGAAYLSIIAKGGEEALRAMKHAASGFQTANQIRSNEASVAISSIRNGLVFFTLALLFSCFG